MMKPYYEDSGVTLYQGDCRSLPMADGSIRCCVTSPPYFGLRDYGNESQIGLEKTPDEYVAALVGVFREVRRVLADNGTLWVNLGDSYNAAPTGRFNGGGFVDSSAKNGGRDLSGVSQSGNFNKLAASGLPPKNLLGIPWRVAFALQADGWYLRQDIIWAKPNPMPESVTDRCTKSHEYLFLLAKSERYYYDAESIKEPAQAWYGQAATFERSGIVSRHIIPGQSAAQHRSNRNGKNSLRGQGVERVADNGRANREGRDMADVGTGLTRNKRSVWTIATRPYPGAHFATFPPELIEPCILAGSRPGDTVLDPFNGSGTTGAVCRKWGRAYVGIDLNAEYLELSKDRFRQGVLFGAEAACP